MAQGVSGLRDLKGKSGSMACGVGTEIWRSQREDEGDWRLTRGRGRLRWLRRQGRENGQAG